jgi:anti-sigma factor RsiW
MKEMHCNELVELVTDFLEGTLTADQEESFLAHLEYCDGCGRYVDQIRHTITALHHQPSPGLTADIKYALLSEFRAHFE